MEKFKNFTENLMKVVLVPDESSDSISSVNSTKPPIDDFSKTATNFLGNFDSECCGEEDCEHQHDTPVEPEEKASDDGVSVFHDTTGLKISFNGVQFSFPDAVVEKIKAVLNDRKSANSDSEIEQSDEEDNKE